MRADDRDDQDERDGDGDRDGEDAAGAPISTSTLDVWVAAVMELYRRQCSMRPNCYPTPAGRAHQQDRHVPARPRRPQAGCLRQPWPGWHRRRVQRRGVLGPAALPAGPQPGQRRRLLPDAPRRAVGALLRPPGPDPAPRRTRRPLPPCPPRHRRAERLRCGGAEDEDECLREVPLHGRDGRSLPSTPPSTCSRMPWGVSPIVSNPMP